MRLTLRQAQGATVSGFSGYYSSYLFLLSRNSLTIKKASNIRHLGGHLEAFLNYQNPNLYSELSSSFDSSFSSSSSSPFGCIVSSSIIFVVSPPSGPEALLAGGLLSNEFPPLKNSKEFLV